MANISSNKRARDADAAADGDERPAKRASSIQDFDNVVTVFVGEEKKRFTLHQDVVRAKPKFFKAACSKGWREGQERIVLLPEAQPDVFRSYCSWVYFGVIANVRTDEVIDIDFRFLTNLYILGDTLDDL